MVLVHRQIWSPATNFYFHRYRISSETTGGILLKLAYEFPQYLDVSARKRFWFVNKYSRMAAIFKIAICPLLTLLQSHYRISSETTGLITGGILPKPCI